MYTFSHKKLSQEQKILRRRILEISYRSGLSHLGSCLSAVDLIDTIYKIKKSDEKFILSNGHAAIAWYVVLEKYGYLKEDILKKLYIHPDMNTNIGIHVSTGSLGQGLPIALGMALADREKNVYCMISDGECAEGSIWEALRVSAEKNITNLKIILNANGWAAYDPVNLKLLLRRIKAFGHTVHLLNGHDTSMIRNILKKHKTKTPQLFFSHTKVEQFPFLRGQDAHYHVMTQKDFDTALRLLQ